jgi:hypothetical protein
MAVRELPVPRKKQNFDRDRVELRAEPEWIARVTAEAERLGLNLSAYIRLAVNERLDRTEAAEPPRRGKSKS